MCEDNIQEKPQIRFKGFSADSRAISHFTEKSLSATNKVSRLQNFSSEKCNLAHESQPQEWVRVKLGDVGETYTGLSGKFKKDFGHGDAKFVTYMNVYLNPLSDLERTENIEIDNSQNCVKNGDVLFTTSSETPEEVGMSSVWTGNEENVYLNSFCFGYRPKTKFDNNFLAYLLRSDDVRKKMIFLAQGISRYNISKNAVMKIKIKVPLNIQEQQKIGKLFASIDSLISLHQKKCEKLKNTKQSLLQKMFPEEGSDTPEIKFKAHEPQPQGWMKVKLGDCLTIERGGSPRPIEAYISQDENGYNWIKIGDAPEFGNYITTTEEKIISDGLSKTRQVFKGDLILSNSMSFGKPYIMAIDGCIHDGWLLLRNDKNIFNLNFLCNLLGTKQMLSQYKSLAAGSTVNNLNKDLVSNSIVSFPLNIQEQEKIGKLFSSIDSLISLHQKKCEKLKNIKKSLLQKMFV